MQTIQVTDELSIEVLGPDDIDGPPAVTVVARRPASIYRLTVRAGEIRPLVAALSEVGGQLVELWKGVDHALAWPIKGTITELEPERGHGVGR